MRGLILTALLVATPALALNEGLQCVPYARALSGVEIRGNADTWWGQASGRYERGSKPKVGAIMSFRPHGKMRLGHVAAVRRIVDSRTVIISHANWSTINGIRGHVEQNVRAVDVSENNDWSRVKVWYTPNQAMGSTAWPLNGFIYPKQKRSDGDAHRAVVAILGNRAPKFQPVGGKLEKEQPVKFALAEKPNAKDGKKDEIKLARAQVPQAPVKYMTAAKPGKAEKPRFTLSASLLAEVDKRATQDAKAAKGKKRVG